MTYRIWAKPFKGSSWRVVMHRIASLDIAMRYAASLDLEFVHVELDV